MPVVKRTISIAKEMDEWLRKNHISLSKLVQDAINEEMKRKR